MRHLRTTKKLGKTSSHRKAMLENLATSILDKERVVTTLQKARAARSIVERLITYAKRGGVSRIRLAARKIKDKQVLKKLFDKIGPAYKDREGGYTRIIKLKERKGDRALMVIIELVNLHGNEPPRKSRKKKTTAKSSEVSQSQAIATTADNSGQNKEDNKEIKEKVSSDNKLQHSAEQSSTDSSENSSQQI